MSTRAHIVGLASQDEGMFVCVTPKTREDAHELIHELQVAGLVVQLCPPPLPTRNSQAFVYPRAGTDDYHMIAQIIIPGESQSPETTATVEEKEVSA